MHFQGRELISRATRVTARTLLVSSFALLLVYFAGDKSNTHAVIGGLKLHISELETAGSVMIMFLVVSHAISWNGDRLSYQRWNVSEKTGSKLWDTSGTMISKIDEALEIIKSRRSAAEEFRESLNKDRPESEVSDRISRFDDEAKREAELLQGIRNGIDGLNGFALGVLYVWFGAVPILVGFSAVVVSVWCGDLGAPEHSSN